VLVRYPLSAIGSSWRFITTLSSSRKISIPPSWAAPDAVTTTGSPGTAEPLLIMPPAAAVPLASHDGVAVPLQSGATIHGGGSAQNDRIAQALEDLLHKSQQISLNNGAVIYQVDSGDIIIP